MSEKLTEYARNMKYSVISFKNIINLIAKHAHVYTHTHHHLHTWRKGGVTAMSLFICMREREGGIEGG